MWVCKPSVMRYFLSALKSFSMYKYALADYLYYIIYFYIELSNAYLYVIYIQLMYTCIYYYNI